MIKHAFTNPKSDGGDATVVRPSDWNAAHAVDDGTLAVAKSTFAATQRVAGRDTAGSGNGEEVTASQIFDWVSNANGALLTRISGAWGTWGRVGSDPLGNDIVLSSVTGPLQTGAGTAKLHSTNVAGRNMPSALPGDGANTLASYQFQPLLARCSVTAWRPSANVTTWVDNSGNAATTQGTATARAPASTRMATSLARVGYVSAGGAGSVAQIRAPQNYVWIGNLYPAGGFFLAIRFMISDASLVATARMFAGLQPTAGATDVDPSTLTNLIGVGCNNGDTNLQLYAAGGAAQARVDLGSNFPVNTISTDIYGLILFCAPSAARVDYLVTRLNTGQSTSGSVSGVKIPANTTFMAPSLWRSNGGTATAVGVDLVGMYLETDA